MTTPVLDDGNAERIAQALTFCLANLQDSDKQEIDQTFDFSKAGHVAELTKQSMLLMRSRSYYSLWISLMPTSVR